MVVGDASAFTAVPVLDMGLLRGGQMEKDQFIADLRQACVLSGVFYVKNHGIPSDLCNDLLSAMDSFFALPDSDKDKIAFVNSPHWRGYAPLGAERTARRVDVREQIEFGLERPPSPLDLIPAYLRLHGPNQWPSSSLDSEFAKRFRLTTEKYMTELQNVSEELLQALECALGLKDGEMMSYFHQDPHVRMKLVRYPPASETAQSAIAPEQFGHGVGPHKDYGFFGCLLQDDVGGLQYQTNVTKEWIDATPIPGTLVVTLGEMIEQLTGGICRATTHRVLVPPRARRSANFFYCPRVDARVSALTPTGEIQALCERRDAQEAASSGQFEGHDANRIFEIYGENALKGMCRSHPDIVERHHPDLRHLVE